MANSRTGSSQIRGELNQDDVDGHARWMGKRPHRSTLHQDCRQWRELGTGGGGPRRVFSAKWPSPEDMHAGGIIWTEQVIFMNVWIYYIHIFMQ